MKEVSIKLYTFDELSKEVKGKIIEKERFNVGYKTMESYGSDYKSTLDKFSELMGINVYDWSVDYCTYHFRFKFNDYAIMGDYNNGEVINAEKCVGKLLRRFINRNFLKSALPRKKYIKYDAGYDRGNKRWNKQRLSNIQYEKWDDCPLTGCCYDYEVMEPIIQTIENIIPENFSLIDLVEKCLDQLFSEWHKGYEYWCDTDSAIEEVLSSWYESDLFYVDGTKFDATCKEVA